MKNQGFTLIELLIVMMILALMLGVVVPVSITMYARYKAGLVAEAVLVEVSGAQREAFLYGEVVEITAKEGVLLLNDRKIETEEATVKVVEPLLFFTNGTSSGGNIQIDTESGFAYKVHVEYPLGKISLEQSGGQSDKKLDEQSDEELDEQSEEGSENAII